MGYDCAGAPISDTSVSQSAVGVSLLQSMTVVMVNLEVRIVNSSVKCHLNFPESHLVNGFEASRERGWLIDVISKSFLHRRSRRLIRCRSGFRRAEASFEAFALSRYQSVSVDLSQRKSP